MKKILIIPAYNEEDNIINVVTNLNKWHPDYDYIVVNDGSTDNTRRLLIENNVEFINLPINLGFSGAVQTGYRYAYENDYDVAIQFDGDGQHLPEFIDTLVDEVLTGTDIAIGSRFIDSKKDWSMRMIGSRLISICTFLVTGRKLSDPTSGMRAVGKKVMKVFSENLDFIAEPDTNVYLLKNKYNLKEVSVDMKDREAGESHFSNPINSVSYMIKILISILFVQSMRSED
jgi:glycosyltransferase involved in cell wall biosynthesis